MSVENEADAVVDTTVSPLAGIGLGPTGPHIPKGDDEAVDFRLGFSPALEPFTDAAAHLNIMALTLAVKTLRDIGESRIAEIVLERLRSLFPAP